MKIKVFLAKTKKAIGLHIINLPLKCEVLETGYLPERRMHFVKYLAPNQKGETRSFLRGPIIGIKESETKK